jgi:hypothetical protein
MLPRQTYFACLRLDSLEGGLQYNIALRLCLIQIRIAFIRRDIPHDLPLKISSRWS